MFPTFSQYTTKHPRTTVLVGFAVFLLFACFWLQLQYVYVDHSQITQVVDMSEQQEVPREMTFEEKMQILNSLKSSDDETLLNEEKMETLESLSLKEEENTITTDEKMKILDSLKSN
ncbi:MAG: hypothetical protein K9M10_02935 [Candidatus Pacebacteria bacterium]|nr:hypothetical protein [Candidatus Paceibacterota bacterium]MCF7857408.1 hypothetical protein [Candidatus Paceibacterota bacterium]